MTSYTASSVKKKPEKFLAKVVVGNLEFPIVFKQQMFLALIVTNVHCNLQGSILDLKQCIVVHVMV